MPRPGRIPRPWPLAGALLVAAVVVAVLAVHAGGDPDGPSSTAGRPARVDAAAGAIHGFYAPPSPLPRAAPGTMLRTAPLPGVPAGARGWRILYLSRGADGRPAAL